MNPSVIVANVAVAREACGCSKCLGGYPIGTRTLAVGGNYALPGPHPDIPERPSSCVAGVVLDHYLRLMRAAEASE